MIKEWLDQYHPKTRLDAEQALREMMQQITLAGLQRNGFFEKAAFYGGSALRIFHGLPRYSEDLDFSLLETVSEFSLQHYLDGIVTQFEALGIQVRIASKNKIKKTNIDSAFLNADTILKELVLKDIPQERNLLRPDIKIKIEVDTTPPLGFSTEEKLLLQPFSLYVKCFSLPDLFAGKMHALLFRQWRNRVKGRDWFDLEWYIKKKVPLSLEHLKIRAQNSGNWTEKQMNKAQLMQLLEEKIDNISFSSIREDIIRFIPDPDVLEIWSPSYFHDLIQHIQIKA